MCMLFWTALIVQLTEVGLQKHVSYFLHFIQSITLTNDVFVQLLTLKGIATTFQSAVTQTLKERRSGKQHRFMEVYGEVIYCESEVTQSLSNIQLM